MHGHIFSKMQRGGLAPSCYRPSNDQPDEAGALHALLNMLYMVKISPPPPVALCVMALSASLIRRPHLHLGDLLPDHLRVAHLRAGSRCELLRVVYEKQGGERATSGARGRAGTLGQRCASAERRMASRRGGDRAARARDRAGYELNKF